MPESCERLPEQLGTADNSLSRSFAPAIRASLNAKLERLLARPIIASIVCASQEDGDLPEAFRALQTAAFEFNPASSRSQRTATWREDPDDGTCSVRIFLDYDDRWRGCEKEIVDAVSSTVEQPVALLTDVQKALLVRSPREFLALNPRPETAELISFEIEVVGGGQRVVELRFAAAPESRTNIRHVAIVPNLVQIERQLIALHQVEAATDEGPLAPLRALIGASGPARLSQRPPSVDIDAFNMSAPDDRLDEHQAECVRKAMRTPHFAIIEGPPGSGKTTVIASVIRRSLARGERVLVVSPTHVAVDNVVEKLVPRPDAKSDDLIEARSLPVRYAARAQKLSDRALEYWVGARKSQQRVTTVSRRIQARLCKTIPFASALFEIEDTEAAGHPPISDAVARMEQVICGTPIGILSFGPVKNAHPGTFDLLIVDEVSKMTIPEFLAIAVKARRWVLVGDPAQLPPYNNSEENATTLDDVINPLLELACSVGAILERTKPHARAGEGFVVVSSVPTRAVSAIRAHLGAVMPLGMPPVGTLSDGPSTGIIVCSAEDSESACERLSPLRDRDRSHAPEGTGTVRILVERGVPLTRPAVASGKRLVDARHRAQPLIFEDAFNVYHAQPWGVLSGQRLRFLESRNALEKYLPSDAAIASLDLTSSFATGVSERRSAMIDAIAERFAINVASVYDWLTGIPTACFDTSPLQELAALASKTLCEAVRPFVGTLKLQYRMHSSLSRVPRELFYDNRALHDGAIDRQSGCRVSLLQVAEDGDEGECNRCEIAAICALLEKLNSAGIAEGHKPEIMVITPYRKQESRLNHAIGEMRQRNAVGNLEVEVCTLDRCQGREAEYVLISLVRSRATPFFDMPKRWNVALTRAKDGLFIVGNVDAYLCEARRARSELCGRSWKHNGPGRSDVSPPRMSVLARVIEAYARQLAEGRQRRAQ